MVITLILRTGSGRLMDVGPDKDALLTQRCSNQAAVL